jgi:hypothetical protein
MWQVYVHSKVVHDYCKTLVFKNYLLLKLSSMWTGFQFFLFWGVYSQVVSAESPLLCYKSNLLATMWIQVQACILVIVVTYSQFDSNIRVLYIFLGFLKNTWKYLKILDHRCLWVWAQLKLSWLSVLFIVFTYFTYSHFQILKYLKILFFEHVRKIHVFCMSLLWFWCQTALAYQNPS